MSVRVDFSEYAAAALSIESFLEGFSDDTSKRVRAVAAPAIERANAQCPPIEGAKAAEPEAVSKKVADLVRPVVTEKAQRDVDSEEVPDSSDSEIEEDEEYIPGPVSRHSMRRKWTSEELKVFREELEKGKPVKEIFGEYFSADRIYSSVKTQAQILRKQHGISERERKPWTEKELKVFREELEKGKPVKAIFEEYFSADRTYSSIMIQAHRLRKKHGISEREGKAWTEEELRVLRRELKLGTSTGDIHELYFQDRSYNAVAIKICKLKAMERAGQKRARGRDDMPEAKRGRG